MEPNELNQEDYACRGSESPGWIPRLLLRAQFAKPFLCMFDMSPRASFLGAPMLIRQLPLQKV